MRLRRIFIAAGVALAPDIAMAQPIDWVRYQIPETGAAVDIPTSIFTEDAIRGDGGGNTRHLVKLSARLSACTRSSRCSWCRDHI